MTRLGCPKCEGSDVRRLSVVYGSGTSSLTSESGSIGIADVGGHLALGGAQTSSKGTQQSLLARQVAPPPKRDATGGGCLAVCAVIVGTVGIASFSSSPFEGIAWLLFAVLLGVGAERRVSSVDRYNAEEWTKLKAAWDRSFLCMRCGHRFEASI